MTYKKILVITAILLCGAVHVMAQTVADELRSDVRRAAGMHYAQPVTELPIDMPPAGKKPFYINHYGSPAVYYLERPEYYDHPYRTLAHADSLGKLTTLGSDVFHRVAQIRNEAREKTGELTEVGKRQSKTFAQKIIHRYPDMFTDETYVDERSIVENHCLLTLGESFLQFAQGCHLRLANLAASQRYQSWMNPHDELLEHRRTDSLTMLRYSEFTTRWAPDDRRLMSVLFNDAEYAKSIDAAALSRQLYDLACSSQNAEGVNDSQTLKLDDIFTHEDIRRHWMRRNAWAYIRYGGCLLNGGQQPYLQRKPLWNLIHMGDSIMKLDFPVVHLRYTRENAVMSLVCLLELDNYGVQTSCLDSLEAYGWADYRIAPLGGSIMFIHYRTDKDDSDPLVRVLLNGHDSKLPIPTDCAPYYHWADVKRYYLRKLYVYAKERNDE